MMDACLVPLSLYVPTPVPQTRNWKLSMTISLVIVLLKSYQMGKMLCHGVELMLVKDEKVYIKYFSFSIQPNWCKPPDTFQFCAFQRIHDRQDNSWCD